MCLYSCYRTWFEVFLVSLPSGLYFVYIAYALQDLIWQLISMSIALPKKSFYRFYLFAHREWSYVHRMISYRCWMIQYLKSDLVGSCSTISRVTWIKLLLGSVNCSVLHSLGVFLTAHHWNSYSTPVIVAFSNETSASDNIRPMVSTSVSWFTIWFEGSSHEYTTKS